MIMALIAKVMFFCAGFLSMMSTSASALPYANANASNDARRFACPAVITLSYYSLWSGS